MNVTALAIILLALYALSVALLRRFALKGLSCTRRFSRPAFHEGGEGEMIETVRNDRPMIVPWLRIESKISPYIRLGRQENLNVSDLSHTCSLFTLMPYQQIRRTHKVRFLRRGEYDLGNASLTAGDLFGFTEVYREQAMHVPVLVYPRLMDERDLPQPLCRLMNEVVSNRRLLSDPFLVRGIRTYQPGDPVRDIHWPATARMGEAQIRLHDYSAQCRLLVVLNVEEKDGQWGDHPSQEAEESIERLISMAATLCMRALEGGHSAGFAANMYLGEDAAFLEPDCDCAARERLLSAFAQLRLRRTLRFPTFLESLNACRDLDMIILSRYDSPEIQAALRMLRANGNQAALMLMEGGAA